MAGPDRAPCVRSHAKSCSRRCELVPALGGLGSSAGAAVERTWNIVDRRDQILDLILCESRSKHSSCSF